VLEDTHDHSCYLARSDEYRHVLVMADSPRGSHTCSRATPPASFTCSYSSLPGPETAEKGG
jgi:hypothetical protein